MLGLACRVALTLCLLSRRAQLLWSRSEEELALERAAIAEAESPSSILLRSAASAELHCHNVRGLAFAGAALFSASEDEVAAWRLPIQ